MSTETPLEDLISRRVVDERERSPDDAVSIAESSEPEAFTDREALGDKTQPAPQPAKEAAPKAEQKPAAKPEGEDGDGEPEGRRLSGLPKWAHIKMQAEKDAKAAAERRAQELEQQLRQLQAQRQPPPQEDPDETVASYLDKRLSTFEQQQAMQQFVVRREVGYRLATKEYGQEEVDNALGWARDRIAAGDASLNQRAYQAPDPVDFAIKEFRKAQFEHEASQYGFDIEKMIAARMAKSQPQQNAALAATQSAVPAQPQNEPRMPGDFTSAPNGAGRVNGSDTGPTPLGELLQLGGRRK